MARAARTTRKRLGEILLEERVIGENELWAALQEQRRTGKLLGETLVEMGYASEDDVAGTIVMQFGMPYLSVSKYEINEEMLSLFPSRLLRQYQFVPIDMIGNVLVVVAGSLLTPDILSELEQLAGGRRILVYVGKQSEVREKIETLFAIGEPAEPEPPPPPEQNLS
ncbi:MAG: GspE/PulE/PilB domain-containing protein, partial [Planctomycetota bacterium]